MAKKKKTKIEERNEELVEKVFEELRATNISEKTIQTYGFGIKNFLEFIDGKPLHEITRAEMKKFLIHLRTQKCKIRKHGNGLSVKSQQNYLTSVRTMFDYLIIMREEGELPEEFIRNPCRKILIKSRGNGKVERTALEADDVSRMVKFHISPRDRAVLMLFFKTGIRLRELEGIDLADVDLDGMRIFIRNAKNNNQRYVYIDEECIRTLKRYINHMRPIYDMGKSQALFLNSNGGGKRLHYFGLGQIVRIPAQRLGIEKTDCEYHERITPHVLRHTFTTLLRKRGCNGYAIKKLRGDADVDMLDHYTHLNEKEIKEEYLQYIPKLGV